MALSDEYITHVPGVQGGEAIVRGTRTPVRTIATLYHTTFQGNLGEVMAALPHLTETQIGAALAYYDMHRAEIEADIRRHHEALETLRKAS